MGPGRLARSLLAGAVGCAAVYAVAVLGAQGSAAQANQESPLYGGDRNSTHFSSLTQITEANVSRLGLAWATDLEAFPGQIEGTPLVVGGTLYGTSPWSVVFAIDARTGRLRWRWDPGIPRQVFATDERRAHPPQVVCSYSSCVSGCHQPTVVTRFRLPEQGWRETMADMVNRGMPGTLEQHAEVLRYLTRYRGTDAK